MVALTVGSIWGVVLGTFAVFVRSWRHAFFVSVSEEALGAFVGGFW